MTLDPEVPWHAAHPMPWQTRTASRCDPGNVDHRGEGRLGSKWAHRWQQSPLEAAIDQRIPAGGHRRDTMQRCCPLCCPPPGSKPRGCQSSAHR